jgi:hypothetical protein
VRTNRTASTASAGDKEGAPPALRELVSGEIVTVMTVSPRWKKRFRLN